MRIRYNSVLGLTATGLLTKRWQYPTDTRYLFLVPYDSLLMDCYVTYLLSTPSQSNISQIKTDITAYLPESSAEVRDVAPRAKSQQ